MNVTKDELALLERRRGVGRNAANGSVVKRVAPSRKEREIQRAILDAARFWKGVRLWKTGGGLLPLADGRRVRMGAVGVSDLVGWKTVVHDANGFPMTTPIARLVAVEVKRLTGASPLTAGQLAFLQAVTEAGGIAIVARSVEDVRRILQP